MRLVLFDIDGTLIHTGGVGKRALSRALDEVLGVLGSLDKVALSGRTDPSLIRDACAACGVPFHVEILESVLERYLLYLEEGIAQAPHRERWLLPGVEALLPSLEGEVPLGLATGNVEAGARLKLGAVNLERFFPVGGFGSDAEDRARLVARGFEKASFHYGVSFSEVVIVGDTPLDIAAARANRFLSVGVASGVFTAESLYEAGADAVLGSLSEARAKETILSVKAR